jgi:hypothetical protein
MQDTTKPRNPKDKDINKSYGFPGNWVPLFECVLSDTNIDSDQKLIYMHIRRRSLNTGFCFEKSPNMRAALGMSRKIFKTALDGLYEKEYVFTNGARGQYWKAWISTSMYIAENSLSIVEETTPMYIIKSS